MEGCGIPAQLEESNGCYDISAAGSSCKRSVEARRADPAGDHSTTALATMLLIVGTSLWHDRHRTSAL